MFSVLELAGNRDGVIDDRREIGRPEQLHRRQSISVVCQNVLDARAMWMRRIPVQWKLMRYVVVGRQLGAESCKQKISSKMGKVVNADPVWSHSHRMPETVSMNRSAG